MDRNEVIYSSLYCGTSGQSALLIYYIYHNHIVRYLLLKTHSSRPLHSSTWVQANCWLVCKCVLHKRAMKRPFSSVIVFVFLFFSFLMTWFSYLPDQNDLIVFSGHTLNSHLQEDKASVQQTKKPTKKKPAVTADAFKRPELTFPA